MADLETLLTYLTLISVPIGVFYHILMLNNAKKNREMQLETRQTQLFMYLYDKWSSEEFHKISTEMRQMEWDDFQDYERKYGANANIDSYAKRMSVESFYEGLGVLVKNGQVKPELVDDLMSHSIITHWEQMRPIIMYGRKEWNYPNYGEHQEYLYNQIKPIFDKQHSEIVT